MLTAYSESNPLPRAHAHRVRLLRSSRKVESILGESLVFTERESLKISRRTSHARPVLVVRLPLDSESSSIPPGGTTDSSLSPTSIVSPNFSASFSSMPRITPEGEIIARRRQMAAKLSRTLGENIPPELVKARRRRRASSVAGARFRSDTLRSKLQESVPSNSPEQCMVRSSDGSDVCLIGRDRVDGKV
ncbi:hypothetical protein MVEN_01113300 [Mycena venus]|uniref:Uncharacterized protein n=1 Tax=Mycena venus TaxID=2733690 RepID=A0A8H7D0J1_9AGAR|nr:hypothetical protein MVEN_01113300 [Mycena venus]